MDNLLKRDGQLSQYQPHQWVAEIVNAIVRARVVDRRYHVTIPMPRILGDTYNPHIVYIIGDQLKLS